MMIIKTAAAWGHILGASPGIVFVSLWASDLKACSCEGICQRH